MFQKFHEQTLIARFIKHLLATEYVPSLQTIREGSSLVAGCNYYFNDTIVECLQSGKFGSTAQVRYHTEQCLMRNFISNVAWYDEDTHKNLGTYLRYFRDKYSIDLMPYYNCYNSKELDDVYLKFTQEEMLTPEDDVVQALAPGTVQISREDTSIIDSPMKNYTTVDPSPWSEKEYIKNVFIDDGVTSIGSNAFFNCKGLVSIVIPKTVTSIGTGAFLGCTNLLDVFYLGSSDEWKAIVKDGNDRLSSVRLTCGYTDAAPPVMDTLQEIDDDTCGDNLVWKLDRDPYEVGLISCSPDLYVGHKVKQELMKFFVEDASADYRVVAVPVLFDTTYTVAFSCDSDVMMAGVLYDNGMIHVNKLSTDETTYQNRTNMKSTYSEYLYHSIAIKRNCNFTSPFTFSIPLADVVFSQDANQSETVKRELYQRQKYLYMIIQLPKNVETSVVVLEGDYTNKTIFNKFNDEGEVISNSLTTSTNVTRLRASDVAPLSLLSYNTGFSYAFSDRLVEYLLNNVIYPQETLSTNIANIQESLTRTTNADGTKYLNYLPLCEDYKITLENKSAIKGAWDEGIQESILRILDTHRDKLEYQYDHDGFVNKDIERLLSLLGVYRT